MSWFLALVFSVVIQLEVQGWWGSQNCEMR
jgi:hypothetical protein